MITNFLFLFGPLLSGVWWGRERHTWSCGGESAPEKAGGDQRWLRRAARPLIGHRDPYWPLIGWLAPHCLVSTGHWILDFCFTRLQGAAAAPVSGAGCCDSLAQCVFVAHTTCPAPWWPAPSWPWRPRPPETASASIMISAQTRTQWSKQAFRVLCTLRLLSS